MALKQMYYPDDLAAMDPLVLMKNLDHVRMTSRRLSYILQQQMHLYTPEANKVRDEIDAYVEAERQIEWEMARRRLRNE
jgi:ABC-type glutathione transport system ATPase component